MYIENFGLSKLPFENVPDPAFFFNHGDYHRIRRRLENSLKAGRGLILLTGPIGSGKTTLSQMIKPDLSDGVCLDNLRLSKTQRKVISPEKKIVSPRNYIHSLFTINGKELSFNVDSKEIRNQEEYLEKVTEARSYLKQLAQKNDGSLDGLPQHEYEKIKEMGITLVSLPKGKVMFYIQGYEMSTPEILHDL